MSIQWVAQEDAHGCGIAALAMVTHQSYRQVRAAFTEQVIQGGMSHFTVDTFLARHGYAVQRLWRSSEFHEQGAWPPEPWASAHIVQVLTVAGGHFVVLLRDGMVLDPADDMPRRLADYPAVQNIAAVYRIQQEAP